MSFAARPSPGSADDRPKLPGSLNTNRRLSQWIRILPSGSVEIRSGKVEIGQGILTALAQIAAEELDVAPARIRMVPARTGESPNEAVTSGSLSTQESGSAIRAACAEARAILLGAAAARLGVAAEILRVEDGDIVAADGRRTSYWAVTDDNLLEREATGSVAPKPASAHRFVGTPAARLDLPDKVFGVPRFLHDLELPGMLHGRVLRPPSPGARLASLDESRARAVPGVVAVVRNGDFVGVIAEREELALRALERLREDARWHDAPALPDEDAMADWLKAQPVEPTVIASRAPEGAATPARTVSATYTRPFLAHASLGPSCAIACWQDGALHVRSHSQGIYNLRADLALTFAMPPERIVVEHVEGAGCYGHNPADDVALDAALLARAADGRPVMVQWTRQDELGWAPFGPAMRIEIETDVAPDGTVLAWCHDVWSNGHGTRPGRAKIPALLAAQHIDPPFEPLVAVNAPIANGGGADRNSVPLYGFPACRVTSHRVLTMPIRTSALRSLGGFANVFAIESHMDDLAAACGADPVAYRLRQIADPRARAVIEAAAARAGWQAWRKREGAGHGLGFAKYKNTGAYCAVVAEIEAEREIRVQRLVIAVDVGLVINPDGVRNQIEGGAVQAVSWTLKERVRFDRSRVTSDSWETYPILRFAEVPAVDVEIVSRPDMPAVGAGEAALGPTAAAIANAVRDALGVRVRDLPITPERIVAAME